MSEYASIDREFQKKDYSLKIPSGVIRIWKIVSVMMMADPVLLNSVELKESVYPSVGWSLGRCSIFVLSRLAHLLINGANPSHEYWSQKNDDSSIGIREYFMRIGTMIVDYLHDLSMERESMTSRQRLCAALRYRAEDGMRDFLEYHGLKPYDLTTIKKRINSGEWPPAMLEFIPVPAWMKRMTATARKNDE